MPSRTVLPWAALPPRLPLWDAVVTWLVFDRLDVPGWAWGIAGTMLVFIWIGAGIDIVSAKVKPLPGYGPGAKS